MKTAVVIAIALLVGLASAQRWRCRRNCNGLPCNSASCAKYPDASCSNDCSNCAAIFTLDGNVVDDCDDVSAAGSNTCDDMSASCFAVPCDSATCTNFPDATCRNNYCNGCNAEFLVDGNIVTCD